jgi:hypothetical protein
MTPLLAAALASVLMPVHALPPGAVARLGNPAALFGTTERLLLSPDGRTLFR